MTVALGRTTRNSDIRKALQAGQQKIKKKFRVVKVSSLLKTKKPSKKEEVKKIQVEEGEEDGNESTCRECGLGGELICCDGCPATYHTACLKLKTVPKGKWFCPTCTSKNNKSKRINKRVAPAKKKKEEQEEAVAALVVEQEEEEQPPTASPLVVQVDETNAYEEERQRRIRANREKMSLLVQTAQKSIMDQLNAKRVKSIANRKTKVISVGGETVSVPTRRTAKKNISTRPNTRQKSKQIRTSSRLKGDTPEFVQLTDDYKECEYERDGRIVLDDDVVNQDKSKSNAQILKKLLEQRCNSKGRGTLYDSKAGITCHFCRQKKLCGEPGCPRCSTRSVTKECIGKSECQKCGSANGRFCRACLLIRYGMVLEDVRKEMEAGTWLCPHCYEEENPHKGWICNSSICMTRRGLAPTGIAIYDAQERGFPSMAHYVQAKMLKFKKDAKCVKI
jgi:hypothetical protein